MAGEILRLGVMPLKYGGSALQWAGVQLEPYAKKILQQPDLRLLRQHRPADEAIIGRQLVVIARDMEPGRGVRKPMLAAGHLKIAASVLEADRNTWVPDEVTEEVLDIAVRTGTDPVRLAPDHLSPMAAHKASHIIDTFDTYSR
jgi:hypothetical protein